MRVATRLILEEGLPHRFQRHAVAGAAVRRGVHAMGLEMFPDASIFSNTVSCVKTPKNVEPAAVVARMRDQYGILIGTSGQDADDHVADGTMAMTASPTMRADPSALELTLRDLGHKCEPGAGVAAAQTAFADAV
jgi:(S)-ureidoglycine-glyoxylate aminotransferase